jgi:hypothetical protein
MNKFLMLLFVAVSVYFTACTKCSTCQVSINQKALGETKLRTYEKCGKAKELNTFENDVKETYKPYGKDATITCVRK